VNPQICELLGNFLFESNPIPLLNLAKMNSEEIEEKHLGGIKLEPATKASQAISYPEMPR
jgi:hypothetical protein